MIWASVLVAPAQNRTFVEPQAPESGTFSNTSAISIPSSGAAGLYPSPITVAGQSGNVTALTVTLNGVTHTAPGDIDALLVGPGGQKFILVSDAGSNVGAPGGAANNN
ncbi:MAG TPA: hypothetical protein VL501_08410, partial [Pyrinomonadaceae bacterium]|nr:hypothetical protein [Pyrinomonadaceae bacterium]